MANVRKFTKAASGHMFAHFERARGRDGEYVKFGNQNINSEKSHLNYNLAPDRGMSQGDFVRKRCSQVYCMNRKDVNVMCSWVVTMPKDLDASRTDEFMKHTYEFLASRYGEENVVSAYVHLDEKTPHMHFAFVPVTHDATKDRDKVSAKEVVSKNELQRFHGELQKHLEERMHCPVNIQNEATKEGNKSIKELQRGTARKELRGIRKEVKALRAEKSDLLSREEFSKELLNSKQVESIKTETPMFGKGKVILSEEDFAGLKKNAAAAQNLFREIKPARETNKHAKEIIINAKQQAKEIIDQAKNKGRFLQEQTAEAKLNRLLRAHPELEKELQPAKKSVTRHLQASRNADLGR